MEAESLQESLEGYEIQLQQINNTLKITPEGDEHNTLLGLQSDIKLLIDMTRENLEMITGSKSKKENKTQDIDDEYAKFMAEMSETGAFDNGEDNHSSSNNCETVEDQNTSITDNNLNIEEEFSNLQGMKCSVLYSHRWGGAATSHNAMVCHVMDNQQEEALSYDNLKVKVLFTNPTHIEMVPCPYFLDGDCKFSDEECKYSHGEIVSLSSLNEAMEPNFELLKPASRVLTKIIQSNQASSSRSMDKYLIWHRAVVKEVDKDNLKCVIKLEHASTSAQEFHTVTFANIFPLIDVDEDNTDTESSQDSDGREVIEPSTSSSSSFSKNQAVEATFHQDHGSVMLGNWEKYTKGIGSKLMHKMGWVTGSGLGVNADGRLQPVQCQITPLGKSLDHCMELKEGRDLSKIDKKRKRQLKQKEKREKMAYEREQDKERRNVFNILNSVLSSGTNSKNHSLNKSSTEERLSNNQSNIKNACSKSLNVEQFKLSEDEKRLNKEIEKIKSSIVRNNSSNSAVYKHLTLQLKDKCQELDAIKAKQNSVTKEQVNRKNSNKLSIF